MHACTADVHGVPRTQQLGSSISCSCNRGPPVAQVLCCVSLSKEHALKDCGGHAPALGPVQHLA